MFGNNKNKNKNKITFNKESRSLSWKYQRKNYNLQFNNEFEVFYDSGIEQIFVVERGKDNSFFTIVYCFDLFGEEIRSKTINGRLYEFYKNNDDQLIVKTHLNVMKEIGIYIIKKYGKCEQI